MTIDLLRDIAENVIDGKADKDSPGFRERTGQDGVIELTQKAIESGIDAQEILNKGLLAGMDVVGPRFKAGEMFIPEVVIVAEAVRKGMDLLRPLIIESGLKPIGKFVIGTVKGDLHDIGKSLVKMMLESARFQVIDLGIDVKTEKFLEVVKEEKPQLLGMSSLLTSTAPEMGVVIKALERGGLTNDLMIMVGGAPISQRYAEEIGADGYAPDAVSAVDKAKELLGLN